MKKLLNLGHVKNMIVKIDTPVPMNIDMEFKALCVMVGSNGSGKSLILKLNWVLGTIIGIAVMKKVMTSKGGDIDIDIEKLSQYTFDKSFDDQDFNGTIGADYENGNILVTLENGKIISVVTTLDPELNLAPSPIFMSTNMRTFDQIKQYLKIEKMVESEEQLTDFYKLYDIAYVKFLQNKIGEGYIANTKFKNTLNGFDLEKLELESIEMTDESIYYTNAKGQRLELSILSKGEQAIINMLLANS